MDPLRRLLQKDCPKCLDLFYVDEMGIEHQLFDICETHLKMGIEENNRDTKIDRIGE